MTQGSTIFYEQCIAPYIPEQLQADIEAVEWSEIDQLLTRACHSVELRKPGEDGAINDMLRDMWYEQRLDTRSKPQPAHVLDLLKKKPAETAEARHFASCRTGLFETYFVSLTAMQCGARGRTYQLVPMLPTQNSMKFGPRSSS